MGRVGFQSNSRQMYNHSRASSSFTFYFDRPAFVGHNAMDRGQTQSISLSRLLGGKERLEQPGAGFGVHPATGVADRKSNPGIAKLALPVASRAWAVAF